MDWLVMMSGWLVAFVAIIIAICGVGLAITQYRHSMEIYQRYADRRTRPTKKSAKDGVA